MSQTHLAAVQEAIAELCPEDRFWLQERLVEYRDAIQYLHDH